MTNGHEATDGASSLFRGAPRYVPTTPWGPIGAVVVVLVAIAAMFSTFVIAAFALAAASVPEAQLEPGFDKLASLAAPEGMLTMMGAQIALLAIPWFAAGRGGRRLAVLQLDTPPPAWATMLAGALIVIVLTGLLELLLYVTVGFDVFADSKWLIEGLRSPLWWGSVIIAVVLAPLSEEIAFRGFLLSALAQSRLGFWPGALIANVLWTGLHGGYSAPGVASVFTAGMLLSWLLRRTGSLRTTIVAHALANVAALAFLQTFAPA